MTANTNDCPLADGEEGREPIDRRDPKAAEVHRRAADKAWIDHLRAKSDGRTATAEAALAISRQEDDIAYMLETGTEPRRR